MSQKYYVVWQGRETGIFTDWNTCKKQVDKFTGARYKSFPSRAEAEAAFAGNKPTPGNTSTASSNLPKKPIAKIKTYTADEIALLPAHTKIFSDGGCEPNPGEAGSGLAIYRNGLLDELWYGLHQPNGTNNTAELNALHQALVMAQEEFAKGKSVAIFCDSQYAIQCITQWAVGWEKSDWKKKGGEIKNLALIQPMFALYQELASTVQVLHVNGHVGVEGNELADRMSILAIETRTRDFRLYLDALDVNAILATRAG